MAELDSESISSSTGDEELVESISRFLVRMLRHEPREYGINLNSRGWASVKDVRTVVEREFDVANPGKRIEQVLEADEKNRFQLKGEGTFGFLRATRGHTASDVNLLEVCPDENELSWYLVKYNEQERDYVQAVSESAALRVVEERLSARSADDVRGATVSNVEESIHIGGGSEPEDSLSGDTEPHRAVYQDGRKPIEIFKRINQMGVDIGRYSRRQPQRVRSRLPP